MTTFIVSGTMVTTATWDQTTFVLSVPRRKLADQTQQILFTFVFPSTRHVKGKW